MWLSCFMSKKTFFYYLLFSLLYLKRKLFCARFFLWKKNIQFFSLYSFDSHFWWFLFALWKTSIKKREEWRKKAYKKCNKTTHTRKDEREDGIQPTILYLCFGFEIEIVVGASAFFPSSSALFSVDRAYVCWVERTSTLSHTSDCARCYSNQSNRFLGEA